MPPEVTTLTVAVKLDAQLKADWLKALRSGDYAHGRGRLRRTISPGRFEYCCLGVLAIVAGTCEEALQDKASLDDVGLEHLIGPWSVSADHPSFDRSDVKTHNTPQRALAGTNDASKDFARAVAWIEANL